jgi:UMF1 family MFS transporter
MDKRRIFGWCLYDWANSAYVLTVATAVLPIHFSQVVLPGKEIWAFGRPMAAGTLWGLTISISAAAVFIFAPVLGAAADMMRAKKRFLTAFCLAGAAAALGLGFVGPGDVFSTLLLFGTAQIAFACANVFYDAFLPEIAPPDAWDRISGRGFAFGYIGGGLHFLAGMLLITLHARFGMDQTTASRMVLGSAALWWAGFGLASFRLLGETPHGSSCLPHGWSASIRMGIAKVLASTRILAAGGPISFFLLAFFFYNDGIQTVIVMATIFGREELGLSPAVLMSTLLMIQFVAFAGALVFSRLAEKLNVKAVLSISLVLWTGIALYALVIKGSREYFILGGMVGLVLGGSQALSRSLFARLIPSGQWAQYFGYFSVLNKLSVIAGPLVFAVCRQITGSSRLAVAVISIFFLAGLALLSRVHLPEIQKAEPKA